MPPGDIRPAFRPAAAGLAKKFMGAVYKILDSRLHFEEHIYSFTMMRYIS
jgi:hypothetical protein